MTALPVEPQHVGDVAVVCPACGLEVAVPVLCEFVPDDDVRRLLLRCSPNTGPLLDHLRAVHGHRRLSRAGRP